MTQPFPAPAADTRTPPRDPSWRLGLGLLTAALAFAAWLYFPAYADLVSVWWNSRTFNHGFLILPISLYLVYEKRASLAGLAPRLSRAGLAAVAALSLLGGLGQAADVMTVQHLAAVALWPLIAWALLGDAIAHRLRFPFAYLLFAVPAGETLVPGLQDLTAAFAVRLLHWSGIPVLLEGRNISIPSGDFVVAEACSGISYLIASLALGALYAYLQYRSPWRRLAFLALAATVPIAANGVRAYGIILLAHVSDMRLAVGVDHLIYGWLFFGIVLMLMFWLGNFFREPALEPEAESASPAPLPAAGPPLWLGLGLVLPAIAAGWALAAWLAAGAALAPASSRLPAAEGEWQGPSVSEERLGSQHPGAQHAFGWYESAAGGVYLDLAYYARERQGEELVSSRNHVFDSARWQRLGERTRRVPGLDQDVTVLHLRALGGPDGGSEYLVYTWFDVAGTRTLSPVRAKLLQLRGRLLRQGGGQARLSLAAPMRSREAETLRLLDGFLLRLDPPLSRLTTAP